MDEFRDYNGISGNIQSIHDIGSEGDSIILEDASGRVCLGFGNDQLKMLKGEVVMGVTLAVKGSVDDNGVMNVDDYIFCHDFSVIEEELSSSTDANIDEKYVMILSGISFGDPSGSQSEIGIQLLGEFLSGRLGHEDLASRIVHVLIAGDR